MPMLAISPLALWLVPTNSTGGAARHVWDVAGHGLPGWRMAFLVPEGPVADGLRARGAAVVADDFGVEAGVAASVRALHRSTRTLRPAIVHSHLAFADFINALTPHQAFRVSTEHGIAVDDRVYHRWRLQRHVMASAHHLRLRRFDWVIAVSRATKRTMHEKWSARTPVTVIPNGIDRPTPAPARGPGLHIASLARLAPEKRIDRLLPAYARIQRHHPEARLTIAGEGPLQPFLRARAAELGLTVDFAGQVPAAELLASVDVVAQLSVFENCSYALLDAAAAGCGVVATPVGGNPEILPARCLVTGDETETVARAIVRQGSTVAERPRLPPAWPSVGDMCRRIGGVYAGFAAPEVAA